jgi:hypothetical protein
MKRVLVVLLLVAAGAALWFWVLRPSAPAAVEPAAPAATATASAPAAPASEPASPAPVLPAAADPLRREDIAKALEEFVGSKAVSTFFQLDEVARRIVATVDNLGREHAPSALWPVHPTSGRFTVDESGGTSVIAADNAGRYTPLVLLAETIDAARAARLYQRMYPLLQQEYEQLGYPRGVFHQRLMEVIARLLDTPEPEQAPRVQLLEVKGPIPSVRPWVRYEYADPVLEQLSSGQKIMLRIGLVNERRLKKKLAEFREAVGRLPQQPR